MEMKKKKKMKKGDVVSCPQARDVIGKGDGISK
jgi:hypothetical protein